MSFAFDQKLALTIAEKAIAATKDATKLDMTTANDAAQLAMSIFAVGFNVLPVVGPALSALAALMALVVFPTTAKDPWDKVRERVESLVGTKIAQKELLDLQSKMKGFKINMDLYKKALDLYDAEKEGAEKTKLQSDLRNLHVALLVTLRGSIPEFQKKEYAVIALPLFARAATLHLTLLADGINNGLEWGYSEKFRTVLFPEEFQQFTASGKPARRSRDVQAPLDKEWLDMMKSAIESADSLGVPPELLKLWTDAYTNLVKDYALKVKRDDGLDYVSHVKKYYAEGRKLVKPKQWNEQGKNHFGKGYPEALAMQSYAEYDTEMFDAALVYSEMWPYMDVRDPKAKLPEAVGQSLDREIFFGPYARYTEHVAWNKDSAAPLTRRGGRMTGVKICADENVSMLEVQYENEQPKRYGECIHKNHIQEEEQVIELAADEYIENIDVVYGHKLGKLTFTTNKGTVHGPYGKAVKAEMPLSVNRTGSALTGMYATHHESDVPAGLEGIVFGFRSLQTAGDVYKKSAA